MDDFTPAAPPAIRFDDAVAYEDFMGRWSCAAGQVLLDWLAPPGGWRWVDVGCGNGACTALLAERCAPAALDGIDPSAAQIAHARQRLPAAHFMQGDAMALPYADAAFDAALMALVIFFVPDPPRAVAEMARVVRPGGSIAADAWDMAGGGFPYAALHEEMVAVGVPPLQPPSPEASRLDVLQRLWQDAGLVGVRTRVIDVERRFDSFDAWWRTARSGPRIGPALASLPGDASARLEDRLRRRLTPDMIGTVTVTARANAVEGRVPG